MSFSVETSSRSFPFKQRYFICELLASKNIQFSSWFLISNNYNKKVIACLTYRTLLFVMQTSISPERDPATKSPSFDSIKVENTLELDLLIYKLDACKL